MHEIYINVPNVLPLRVADFTTTIKIEQRGTLIFEFIKINKVGGPDFFVTLAAKNDSISFRMREHGRQWKIVNAPKVPDWLMAIENELSQAIESFESDTKFADLSKPD